LKKKSSPTLQGGKEKHNKLGIKIIPINYELDRDRAIHTAAVIKSTEYDAIFYCHGTLSAHGKVKTPSSLYSETQILYRYTPMLCSE